MGHIKLIKNSLIIENLEIKDKETIDYFSKLEESELEENLIKVIKLGVISLKLTSTTKDVLFIQSAFDEMKDNFSKIFNEFLGSDGTLCKYFDENDKQSFLSKIQDLISSELNVNKEGGSFFELKKILIEHLLEIGKGIALKEGKAEERKKGTQKGKDFEQFIYSHLDEIAHVFEDTVDMTGDTPGKLPNNKTGDMVITLNPKHTGGVQKKLVVEVKDKKMTLKGKDNLFLELDEAMQNRGADFGIFIWSKNYAADEVGVFRTYPPLKIVCTVDLEEEEPDMLPVEMAYKIARAEVINQLKGEEVKINRDQLKDLITKAINRINQASAIKSSITKITNSLDSVKDEITALKDDSIEILKEIDILISTS